MIRGGKGGAKTLTGLRFEKRVSLKELIGSVRGYSISNDNVLYKGKPVARLLGKHKLYKNLLEPNDIDYSKLISSKLLPDESLLVLRDRVLFIIEIKFQEVQGSVDEKLQTCDFKNRQYQRLLTPLGIKVKYLYVLNDWFEQDRYKDVLNYIQAVGCHYFFHEVPFDFLGLPRPSK